MTTKVIKETLLKQCNILVQQRFEKIRQTITGIEESLFGESKSSAGDKHETSRAMLQIDRENAGKQLHEIQKLQRVLRKIDVKTISENAHLGSLVYTDKAMFFLSISVGDIQVDGKHYFCVAIASPIGQLLLGKKKDESILFNGKAYRINAIA